MNSCGLARILTTLVVLAATAPVAVAVTPEPDPRVCTEFFRSDLVFTGTVTDEFRVFDTQGFLIEYIYDVEAQDFYRGGPGIDSSLLQVRSGVHSAGRYLEVGESYLLFAYEFDGKFNGGQSAFMIGAGGNSGRLSESGETIREMERIMTGRYNTTTGNIRGWIYDRPNQDVEGIKFTATNGEKSYVASTDSGGWFEFDVPPGMYRVEPETGQSNITVFDLSYDNPEKIEVKAGRCAEIAFWIN